MSQPPPSLQTVATLTGGTSPVMQQAFFWGIPGRPFSVGTHGDWVVNGPGVQPLHFFLNFDGRMILVASGPSGANVTISGVPVDHNWRAVPVFAEIAFGGARIRVTCEDAPQQTAIPEAPPPVPMPQAPPPQQTAAPPPNPASFEAPVHTPQTLDRTAYLRPRQLRTEPLAMTPEQVAYVQTAAAPLQVSDSAAPQPYTPAPPARFPAEGAPGGQPPPALAPNVHSPAPPAVPRTVHSPPPPGLNATTRSAAPPTGVMVQDRSFSPPQVTIPTGQGSAPPPPAAAPLGTPVPSAGEDDVAGVSTLSDAGALRALADRVQTDPAASQAHAAYFAEVQRAWVEQSIPPAAGAPPPPPRLAASAPPADIRQNATSEEPDLAEKKPTQKTSWVMRLVMLLLPVAGYFAIFWEPPASAPAPAEDESAEAKSTATSTTAARPPASVRVPATASASVGSAAAPATLAAPSSSGPLVLPASASPIVAPAPSASPAKAERPGPATPTPGASAPASPSASASPLPTRLAQQALNAAFEGRLSEAAERYERLAAGPDGEAYRASARLIRERAIRKP
jgi:hypothetical protein